MPRLPIGKEIIHILDNRNSFSLNYLASLFLLKLTVISNPAASTFCSVAASSHNHDTCDVKHPSQFWIMQSTILKKCFGLRFRGSTRIKILLSLLFLLSLMGTASATATYSYDSADKEQYSHIFLSGSNTLDSIYNDIGNSAYISKSGNTYTLKKDIFINYGATLTINGQNLTFGIDPARTSKPVRIWNMGSLQINNAFITSNSGNPATYGYISSKTYYAGQYWQFNVTNSRITNLGPIVNNDPWIDEYGNGIFALDMYSESPTQCVTPVSISNNYFSGTSGVHGGSDKYSFDHNYVTKIPYNAVWLNTGGGMQLHDNQFINNDGAYKIGILWSNCQVYNNVIKNAKLLGGGQIFDIKEGVGGVQIYNNTIDNLEVPEAISLSGSHHTKWSYVKNNRITNIKGIALLIQGNGYDDGSGSGNGYDVCGSVENNYIYNASIGMEFLGVGNFGNHYGPRHVITRDNSINNCEYGIVCYNAVNCYDVTSINDKIKNCYGCDVKFTNYEYSSAVQPKFVDLDCATQTSHVQFGATQGILYEYKTLHWTVLDQLLNPLIANIAITNNVDTNYPVIYSNNPSNPDPAYVDTAVSSVTASKLDSPAIMLVKKQTSSGTTNYNYNVVVSKTGYSTNTTPAYNPATATTSTFTLSQTGLNKPAANFNVDKTSGTAPLTVTFTDASTGSSTGWSWNFGDGSTSTAQNPSHTYSTAGTYSVTLTVSNSAGSSSKTAPNYITVNLASQILVASFTASPRSGALPLAVSFTDTSIGTPVSWAWNFGDGQTSTLQNPTHTYSTPGTYNVTLRSTNAAGSNTSTKAGYITVSKATPVITWSNPADIKYGTALSSAQLNAIASVPGSFIYTPSAGTILSAGTQTLHVDFTPNDVADYTTASKNVTINVVPINVTYENSANLLSVYNNRLREASPESVYSNNVYLDVGGLSNVGRYRDVIWFDLSGYTSITHINNATLSLFWYYPNSQRLNDTVIEIYRPAAKWNSGYVSWNKKDNNIAWSNPGGDWYDKNGILQGSTPYATLTLKASSLSSNSYCEFNVTGLVREYTSGKYPNTGLFIKARTESNNYVAFYGAQYGNTSQVPKLKLVYS
jgi:PKD repeat protein